MYMNENLVNVMITTLYIIQTFYCWQLICVVMETPKSLVIIDELNLTRCGICQTTKKGVTLQCPAVNSKHADKKSGYQSLIKDLKIMEDLELDMPFELPPIPDEELVEKLFEKQMK